MISYQESKQHVTDTVLFYRHRRLINIYKPQSTCYVILLRKKLLGGRVNVNIRSKINIWNGVSRGKYLFYCYINSKRRFTGRKTVDVKHFRTVNPTLAIYTFSTILTSSLLKGIVIFEIAFRTSLSRSPSKRVVVIRSPVVNVQRIYIWRDVVIGLVEPFFSSTKLFVDAISFQHNCSNAHLWLLLIPLGALE